MTKRNTIFFRDWLLHKRWWESVWKRNVDDKQTYLAYQIKWLIILYTYYNNVVEKVMKNVQQIFTVVVNELLS